MVGVGAGADVLPTSEEPVACAECCSQLLGYSGALPVPHCATAPSGTSRAVSHCFDPSHLHPQNAAEGAVQLIFALQLKDAMCGAGVAWETLKP